MADLIDMALPAEHTSDEPYDHGVKTNTDIDIKPLVTHTCINEEQFEMKAEHMLDIKDIELKREPSNGEQYGQTEEQNKDQLLENMTNIMYVEPTEDDSLLYCEECKTNHKHHCPLHGPLVVIQNMKVEENDPNRALCSLPPHLLVKESDIVGAGLGVFTDIEILPGTTYGPYEGMFITDPQLANSSDYCWQIYYKNGAPSHYIDGKDTASSNWMRYVNCALSDYDQNLEAFQYKGEIYYRCIKPILPKSELLVWYGDKCAQKFGITKDKTRVIQPNTTDTQENGDEAEPAMHEGLAAHVRIQHGKRMFNINDSRQNSGTEKSVLSRNYTGENAFRCDVCEKQFRQRKSLTRHRKMHSGEKPCICEVCGKAYSDKPNLTVHTRRHTGEKPYICKVCGKAFSGNRNLTSHMRRHTGEKPYTCKVCGKAFSDKGNLTVHMRRHTGEKPYPCKVCGMAFRMNQNLIVHSRVHTGEKPYHCNICDRSFRQKAVLQRHMKIHSGEKPYTCKECGKKFSSSGSLTSHMKIHSEVKTYTCKEYGRELSRSGNLTSHMKIHSEVKPYRCKECFKVFQKSHFLLSHMMMIHSGEKPFTCNDCDRIFSRKEHLSLHMRMHKEDKPNYSKVSNPSILSGLFDKLVKKQ